MIKQHVLAMIIGFILDMCFGDPYWMPHPVRAMGWLISRMETGLFKLFPKGKGGEQLAGVFLTVGVLLVTGTAAYSILGIAGSIHPLLALFIESILCYQMLAAKGLKTESMKVYEAFLRGDTQGARGAVSMIVGRDTEPLSKEGIIKATVETVAENTSDGVVAPLFYMAIGGAQWACLYKAVNTMDSMVGYKNETYINFGRAAAKLDDLLNLIPSRLAAMLMIGASAFLRMDIRNAVKIYKRDRYNHKSPNSAQTEAVCAGALQIQLAGDAYYFGILYEKPTIGDDLRSIEPEDIKRANDLLYMTAVLSVVILGILAW